MPNFFKNFRFPIFIHPRHRSATTAPSGLLTTEELRRLVAQMID